MSLAKIQSGGRGFVAHPFRQSQHIDQRVLLGFVGVEAKPAEGGPESSGMNGDDGLETGTLVVAVENLLMPGLFG
jgi:hypothetical protein